MPQVFPGEPLQQDEHLDVDDLSPTSLKKDGWRTRGFKSFTMHSILSAVDEVDDSGDEDDADPHREATQVERIYELLCANYMGKENWQDSALAQVIEDIPYKGRMFTGKLLHVAALSNQKSSTLLVEHLLEMKALPNEPAHGVWEGVAKKGLQVQPIHLAAAAGNLGTIRSLIRFGADKDARCKIDDQEHYTALHNAVWFSFDEVVLYLVNKKANIDVKNIKGETPLHLAIKSHDLPIVKQLVKAGARRDIQATGGETALDLAMEFSPESIDVVAEKSMESLLLAAKVGSQENLAYKTIVDKTNKLKRSWQSSLLAESQKFPTEFRKNLLKLIEMSPLAGATLLDGLAIEPKPVNSGYGVPRSAIVHAKFFPTALREDTVWPDPSTSEGRKQTWMTQLTNLEPGSLLTPNAYTHDDDEQLVSVKYVGVQGLVSPEFLELIASADEDSKCLCKSTVSLAAMNFCWMHFARATAIANTFYRLLAVCLMTSSVFFKIIATDARLILNQACWHGVAAIVIFEVLCSLILLAQVMVEATLTKPSFLKTVRQNITNFFEWLFNGVSVYMIWVGAQEGFDLCALPSLAALTLLVRWLLLAWSFRTVDGVGQILLPIIMASFEPVKGVLLVALFGFVAFFTAFLALGSEVQNLNILGVLINTMRLLLLGDGDGIDAVLRAFEEGEAEFQPIGVFFLAAAIFMFVIVILNLLIAAYGEASLKDGEIKFRQQIAKVCINAWRRPSWPFGCSILRLREDRMVSAYLAVISIGLVGWIALFFFARDHAAICAWPALALLLGDCILNQKPWLDDDQGSSLLYLWMCHQRNHGYEESSDGLYHHRELHRKLARRLDMRHRKLHRKMEQMMMQAEAKMELLRSASQTAHPGPAQSKQNGEQLREDSDAQEAPALCPAPHGDVRQPGQAAIPTLASRQEGSAHPEEIGDRILE